MKHKSNRQTDASTLGIPSLKFQAKLVRQERVRCKNELLAMLQEVKEKRKCAIALEKRACANESKARKLAKKAELAAREALISKQAAEKAWHAAVEVQELAETKRKLMKEITAKLRLAEQKARQDKKSMVMKQKLVDTSA